MRRLERLLIALTLVAASLVGARPAHAFTHLVLPGETLAQIASRVYGDPKLEYVLAGANALDVTGGSAIVPGMRLEIPAPAYHHVMLNETWYELALAWLGDPKRAGRRLRARGNGPGSAARGERGSLRGRGGQVAHSR